MNYKLQEFVKKRAVWFFLFLTLIIYFSFGSYHLTKFTTADEHFWFYQRIPQYWQAIAANKFEKTRINDKPGITVALIDGLGLLIEKQPKNFEVADIVEPDQNRPNNSIRINAIFRWPILIFNGLFSFYLFYVLKKILQNKWLALLSVTLTILSPILLGISQIANPDTLMWSFSAAAIFSFIAMLQTGEKKFLILSPLFLALSLLSKYSATILYPFAFAMLLSYFFIEKNGQGGIDTARLKFALWGFLSTLLGSLIFYSIFMPAVFAKFQYLLQGTIDYPGMRYILISILFIWLLMAADVHFNLGRITDWIYKKIDALKEYLFPVFFSLLPLIAILLIINAITGLDFLKINGIPFDIRQGKDFVKNTSLTQKLFLEFRQLVFSLQPLVLLGIIWLWIRTAIHKMPHRFLIFVSSAFIVIFYIAVITQDLLANIRYSIMLYAIAINLGALGIWDFFSNFKKRIPPVLIFLGIVAVSVFSLWQTKPFYFNYTNILLPKKYIITGAWGYGGYEAAQYINSQPGADNIKVWADYQGTCEFIKGMCMTKNYKYDREKYSFDYFVFSRRGQILDDKKKGLEKPAAKDPVWTLEINGRPENYLKIYKVKSN